ncbi:unnamed protein product [Rhizophagus irregularis]|uniref:Protein kinase domain-containing protein n=4 Tax=Rhizophagus irregularis TaxID=588596 RepID=A0A915Z1C9_9GLOM|nr:unnamed protein product [Rhizophagus irregularis]CAB5357931.1 unnamed protein product [Rhizophagus irregularis]
MSEVTISGTEINLWLLVRGVATIFEVTIGRDNRISELKKVIKKAREPEFDKFAPDRLKLLKLKNPVDDDHIFDIQNLKLQDYEYENDDVYLMKDMRKIGTYWPENQAPPEDLIHVIVEAPDVAGDEKTIKDLRYELFVSKTDNTRKSSSVYKYVRGMGVVRPWQIEMDIDAELLFGRQVFLQYPDAPIQGSSETKVNQPFCVNVVNEVVKRLSLESELLVFGDYGSRQEYEVYADIIIGHKNYRKELTNSTPDLSKGLGWEVKNDLNDNSKVMVGKGQLIKYARAYLTADRPLTRVFYGCLTDGKLWKFAKIQLLNDINGAPKVKFEQSTTYRWSEHTASLIAGLIGRYYDDLIKKRMSGNKDNTYTYRNKSSISSESLLASFIGEDILIRLKSGNYIHVQITSHLGTGRECIVFLAQVRDYGIKDAVLKIEVCKNTEIFQVCREISVLRALSDLSCVPKILFEGHTMGGSLALLTDFAGLPLESWISDNGNIDDYTIFQIILDLLSCLEKIHARGYAHGDVAIRNVIQRNGHFYLIDFGLATSLLLHFDPWQEIIQDYDGLCQIIGIIKFGEKMSFSELIDKLEGELKSFVAFVEDASRWKTTDEGKCLEKFGAIVRQFYEKLPRKVLRI